MLPLALAKERERCCPRAQGATPVPTALAKEREMLMMHLSVVLEGNELCRHGNASKSSHRAVSEYGIVPVPSDD